MTISHHSHSGQFCRHAKGTLEEVVQKAIRQGFSTFGLSEHVPRYDKEHFYPEEADLSPQDLADTFEAYLVEAHRLKKLYADRIQLLVGLETEYIDDAGLDKLDQLIRRHGNSIDYLVGSVHHCDTVPIDFDKDLFDSCLARQAGPTEQDRFSTLFCTYFDNQYKILTRLEPEVVGHFDLCRLYYPDVDFKQMPEVWRRIERNIDYAIGYGALFEVNASAFRKGWNTAYPASDIFRTIKRKGGRFTLSDDSHGPLAVGLHYDRAYIYLEQEQLESLWYLEGAGTTAEEPAYRRGTRAKSVAGRPWLLEWPNLLTR
ncbi:hypothetical protein BMF94_2295 [Rhodotorula taiwanensis]|uniref:Histidinol-phosphatase n=1 Tax=Rhodotorula taiwanensis TaxID=741276 RepID=A0A2S5BCN3_9BASI|nr:hypothetical protein BMF94_2295 [Rhodotorula taiwanensis]